ncbi:hypothetical protein GQ457_13G004250 [Hibiscus cannabinus]
MFFDVLSSISKPVLPNSDPKTSESDLEPEFAYHDLIEGSVGRRDRSPAQPSSSRSAHPHESVITGIVSFFLIYVIKDYSVNSCRFSPDQAGNPLRPKASPWLWLPRLGGSA